MKTSVSTALRQLRAADPAAGMPPPHIPDWYGHLHAVPDVGSSPAPTARRSTRLQIVAASVAVLVAAGLAGWIVQTHRRGAAVDLGTGCLAATESPTVAASGGGDLGGPRVGPSFGPTGTLGCSDDPHFATTLASVERILATIPVLPHGVSVASPPTPSLSLPAEEPMDTNLIDRAAFWTAPGTVTDALAYFTAHPPAGMSSTGSALSDTPTVTVQTLLFGSSVPSAPTVQISVQAFGGGVAVRADVMAIWVPTKPASAYLGTVDRVDITLIRGSSSSGKPGPGAPTVHQTLTGAAAQHLAGALDALPMETPRIVHCFAGHGLVDDLIFHAGARTIHVVEKDDCAGIAVSIDGAAEIRLNGSIDAGVTAALGLPANYGR